MLLGWWETCSFMHAMGTTQKRADETADYRSALLAERARLAGGKQKELEILVLPGSLAVDDQAPVMHDQFVVLRQHRMDRQKLKLIDAALKRLDQSGFGVCTECEESIPRRRLNIVPWAAYCVVCQDRIDAHRDDGALDMIA
jgi:DnaK suppressor protein